MGAHDRMTRINRGRARLIVTVALFAAALLALIPGTARAATIKAPEAGATYVVGQRVDVRAYSNIYLFRYGQPATNYITFKVTNGGTKVHYDSGGYNGPGATVETSFVPKTPGTYKIEISSPGFFPEDYASFEASDTITIKVKKASAFAKVVPNFGAERISSKRVRLAWDNVGTGAWIYRATHAAGPYKLIKKVSGTDTYVDKVNAKKNYFYKIKLTLKVGSKTYKSKYSHSEWKFASKKPAKPKGLKAKKVKKGVKLTWTQTTDCGHYVIYRSTKKKGSYEAIDYLAGDAATKYVDKSAKKGKTYYYRVESCVYLDWNGVIKSAKSAPVKAKA